MPKKSRRANATVKARFRGDDVAERNVHNCTNRKKAPLAGALAAKVLPDRLRARSVASS
jgi:hypothetical protein